MALINVRVLLLFILIEGTLAQLRFKNDENQLKRESDVGISGVYGARKNETKNEEQSSFPVSGIRLPLAFSAYLGHSLSGLKPGQTVVYDGVLANVGSMYDNSTGVVTIPVTGVYFFSYSLGSRGFNQVFVVLTLDGNQISEAAAETRTQYDDNQGGNSSIFRALKGQKVWIKYLGDDGHIESGENYRITTFTGYLLFVA